MIVDRLKMVFRQRFGVEPELIVRAPGRVNLIGEHTDYNEGLALPAAIDRAVYIAAAAAADDVRLEALDLDERADFHPADLVHRVGPPEDDQRGRVRGWAAYPAGVAWALQNAGLAVTGIRAAIASEIPIGAGLSSSAALEVGFAALWQALGSWELDRFSLARLCRTAENVYIGVNSGLLDQFACACGITGHALLFDARSLEWQPAPIPPEAALVIADSGIRRSLAHTSTYNDRRAECETAVRELKRFMPRIDSLRDVTPTEFAAYAPFLDETPRRRAEHVVKEIARVQSAFSALSRRDLRAFGALMYAGHASLRTLYEVSTPELDALVDLTRSLPGCFGSRLTGAGFGGCTISLVQREKVEEFSAGLEAGYRKATGRSARVYRCEPGPGVVVI